MEDIGAIHPFQLVENVDEILPVLRTRLPNSAHIFNMALTYPKFTDEMSFYTLNFKTGTSKMWIVAKYEREDCGAQICISIPPETKEVPAQVDEAFRNSSLIEWNRQYEFLALDRIVSRVIMDISLDKENAIEVYPCNYFYKKPEDARNMKLRALPSDVTLQSLNSDTGIKFLAIGGPSTTEEAMTYIRKTVERNDYSLGIFVEDKPVSRICQATTGHMGFLMTLAKHRRKGYSTICLERLTHKLGMDTNLYPCAMVDLQNKGSNGVHIQAGLTFSHIVDFIIYKGNVY